MDWTAWVQCLTIRGIFPLPRLCRDLGPTNRLSSRYSEFLPRQSECEADCIPPPSDVHNDESCGTSMSPYAFMMWNLDTGWILNCISVLLREQKKYWVSSGRNTSTVVFVHFRPSWPEIPALQEEGRANGSPFNPTSNANVRQTCENYVDSCIDKIRRAWLCRRCKDGIT
jgi:hypothetical protein